MMMMMTKYDKMMMITMKSSLHDYRLILRLDRRRDDDNFDDGGGKWLESVSCRSSSRSGSKNLSKSLSHRRANDNEDYDIDDDIANVDDARGDDDYDDYGSDEDFIDNKRQSNSSSQATKRGVKAKGGINRGGKGRKKSIPEVPSEMMLRASPTIRGAIIIDDDSSSPDVSSFIMAAPHVPLKTYRTKDRAKDIDIDKFIMASGGTRDCTIASSDDDPAVSDIDDIDGDDGDGDDVPMAMTESQPLPTDRKVSRISDHKIDGDAEDAEYGDDNGDNFYSNEKHHHDGYFNHQNSKRYNITTTASDRIIYIGQQQGHQHYYRGHQHHQLMNISKSGRQPVQDLPAVLQKSESMDTSIGWKRSDDSSSEAVREGDVRVVYDEASNDGDKSLAYNTTTKQSEVTQRTTDKARISSRIVSRIPLTNSHIRFDREDSNLLVLDNGVTTALDNNNNINNSIDEDIRKKRKLKSKEVSTHHDDSLDINSSNNNINNYQAADYFSVDDSRRSASPEDDGNNNNNNNNKSTASSRSNSNSNAYSQSVESRMMLTSLKKEDVFDLTEDDP